MIDDKVVRHVAKLSRLSVSDEEVTAFTHQLGAVLGHIDQLNAIDTSNVGPTALMAPSHDPLRDDEEVPSLSPENLLANGPKVVDGHFAVPKVINQ